jgi:putative DNA primase/helicase
LTSLVTHRDRAAKFIASGIEALIADVVPEGSSGQTRRVARRFATVAVAGELATQFGLTGWSEEEAYAAVKACFESWLSGYGSGNREDSLIETHARLYLEMHRSSRFQQCDSDGTERIANQAGYWKDDGGQKLFLVTPEVFKKEVAAGFNQTTVARVLKEKGMLITDAGRHDRTMRIPAAGPGSKRVYCMVIPEKAQA